MGGKHKDRDIDIEEDVDINKDRISIVTNRRKSLAAATGVSPLCTIDVDIGNGHGHTLPHVHGLDDNTLANTQSQHLIDDAFHILLKQPFVQVCRVSPLYNFKYGQTKLKQYALKIKQFISTNVKTTVNINYKTEIRVVDNLKLDVSHSDGVMILVWKTNDAGEEVKLLYRGILFSWGCFAVEKEPNVTHLPLLLDFGQNKYVTASRNIISKLFDCVICPMACTQSELLLFSALLSSFSPVHGAKLITFTYNIPMTKVATSLDISLEADDIHSWWKSCYEQNDTKVYDVNTTKTLYSLFREYVISCYGIDVAQLVLTNLNYPGVTLHSRGSIKIRDLDAGKIVLKILCEMSVILRGSTPKLSYDYY